MANAFLPFTQALSRERRAHQIKGVFVKIKFEFPREGYNAKENLQKATHQKTPFYDWCIVFCVAAFWIFKCFSRNKLFVRVFIKDKES
jgi:hypothetical protein